MSRNRPSSTRVQQLLGFAGQWFIEKYRRRQRESGTFVAAQQMRKQGVPIEIALSVLATR